MIEDKNRERFDEVKAEISRIEAFLNSEGWKEYKVLVEGTLRSLRDTIFNQPLRSNDDAFQLAELKGKMAGVQFAFTLFAYRLEELNYELSSIKEQQEQENNVG